MRPAVLILSCLLLVAACREPEPAPNVHPTTAREAARMACATEYLLERAREDLATLTEALPGAGEDAGARTGGASALLVFSRAYLQYAEVAAGRYTHLGTALNARTREDSAYHVQRAAEYALSPPADDTLEGNVALAYGRNVSAVLDDPEHPCNVE